MWNFVWWDLVEVEQCKANQPGGLAAHSLFYLKRTTNNRGNHEKNTTFGPQQVFRAALVCVAETDVGALQRLRCPQSTAAHVPQGACSGRLIFPSQLAGKYPQSWVLACPAALTQCLRCLAYTFVVEMQLLLVWWLFIKPLGFVNF